jgi:hypothetical protein
MYNQFYRHNLCFCGQTKTAELVAWKGSLQTLELKLCCFCLSTKNTMLKLCCLCLSTKAQSHVEGCPESVATEFRLRFCSFLNCCSMQQPAPDAEPLLLWVYARSVDRIRFGSNREEVASQDVYTRFVKGECLRGDLVPDGAGLDENSAAEAWSAPYRHLAGNILGLVLCKPASISSLMLYLGRQQRHLQDFWQATPFHKNPVMFIEILAGVSLQALQPAFSGNPGFAPRGIFFKLTRFTADRCAQTPLIAGGTLQQLLADWAVRFNHGQQFVNQESMDLAISMPIPHAMLCNVGRWAWWCFPLAGGRQGGGLGLNQIHRWLAGINLNALVNNNGDDEPQTVLSSDFLQGLADIMRAQLAGVATPDEVLFYISWAQTLRSVMLRNQLGLSRRVYSFSHMVHCMIMSGLLAKRDSLRDAVAAGLRSIVQEKAIQDHYMAMLKQPATLPSQTTLYRHRLTIHMAYLKLAQQRMSVMLSSGGGGWFVGEPWIPPPRLLTIG